MKTKNQSKDLSKHLMEVDTKILHIEGNKVAKNGSRYSLVHLLIQIDGQEFVRKFAIFSAENQLELKEDVAF